ncbi:MAG: hypothetical protein ACTSRU_11390 [Candidatus Hodarchaeales archaeon]
MSIESPVIQKIVYWFIPKIKPLVVILGINVIVGILISLAYLVDNFVNLCIIEGGIFLVFGGIILSARSPSAEKSGNDKKLKGENKKSDIAGINPPKIKVNSGKFLIELSFLLLATGIIVDMIYRLL